MPGIALGLTTPNQLIRNKEVGTYSLVQWLVHSGMGDAETLVHVQSG